MPVEEACCLPDGSCTYLSPDRCIAAGGFFPAGGVCLGDSNGNGVDDACEEPEPCCLDEGRICIDLPPWECEAQGGFPPPGGVCLGDLNGDGFDDGCVPVIPCEESPYPECGGECPPPLICRPDSTIQQCVCVSEEPEPCCLDEGRICVYLPPSECEAQGGFPPPGGVCLGDLNGDGFDDGCVPVEEACCLPDGSCVYISPDECRAAGGFPPPGGICLGDADGNGVDDACEGTFEDCCLPDGSCVTVPAGRCVLLGGFIPPGGTCLGDADGDGVDDACEGGYDESCCLPDGSCVVVPAGECGVLGGFIPPGGICLGDADGNGVDDACEDTPPDRFRIEFSLDIGSDIELSDPFMDGDEAADPGDVYLWHSAPIVPPGRDGFKDDRMIFMGDPMPDPPDPLLTTRVPVGEGTIEQYREYFDLDGHDQINESFYERQWLIVGEPRAFPIPAFDSPCIYRPMRLAVSFDDDMAPGWPAGDVAVTVPSPAGVSSYGSTAGRDEVYGFTVAVWMVGPPYPTVGAYPIANEIGVHASMAPNPDGVEEYDDDVDSLDVIPRDSDECSVWYFSPDHEAHLGLDPGSIYEVTPIGPVQVIDDMSHLGLRESTDIDAFEFAWIEHPDFGPSLALLFSVDEDDPLTPMPEDESGGLDPSVIYVSLFMGESVPLTEPLHDDVDALTIGRWPFVKPRLVAAYSVGRHNPAGAYPGGIVELPIGLAGGLMESREQRRGGLSVRMVFDQPVDVADLTVTMAPPPPVGFGLSAGAAPNEVLLQYDNDVAAVRYDVTIAHADFAGTVGMFPICYHQGDVNCSGDTTALDLAAMQSPANWNQDLTVANPRADVNRDGQVTGLDQAKAQIPAFWNKPVPPLTCTCP